MTGAAAPGPRVVVLTGAGVSAESGIGTFRDKGGLWSRLDWRDLATPEGFARDPEKVLAFYDMRRARVREAQPNAAHAALARLEAALDEDLLLVTQNVDELHEAAGAARVIHMHGRHSTALCAACGHRWPAPARIGAEDPCPACGAAACRPDVVWFGETPHHLDRIGAALSACRIFAAIGTSGAVYPAAGFVAHARASGAHCVELNLAGTETSDRFHDHLTGPATEVVPAWVDSLIAEARG